MRSYLVWMVVSLVLLPGIVYACSECKGAGNMPDAHKNIVMKIPPEGFGSLDEMKLFAHKDPWRGRVIEVRIGGRQAWVVLRSFGASGSVEEMAIFSLMMGRYHALVVLPPGLVQIDVEQAANDVLNVYHFDAASSKRVLLLAVHQLALAVEGP